MRLINTMLIVILFFIIFDYSQQFQQVETIDFEQLLNGTVVIYYKGDMGTGVCIREDEEYSYILTAAHVVTSYEGMENRKIIARIPESNMGQGVNLREIREFLTLIDNEIEENLPPPKVTNISIKLRNGIMIAGELVGIDERIDLALLKIVRLDDFVLPTLKLSDLEPKIGDRVYVVGHPLGRTYNLSSGIVSYLADSFIRVDAMMIFGNSGGGIFNDKGEIIGIASSGIVYAIEEIITEKETNLLKWEEIK